MENVGLLYLKTGGGHLSAAKALEAQMAEDKSLGAEPILIDPIRNNQFLKNILEGGYGKLSTDFKYLWPALYNIQKSEDMILFVHKLMQMVLTDVIAEDIITHRIERLVIFHFLLIKPVEAALKKTGLNIPVVTVILDPFTAPPIWYTGNRFPIYCFSDQVALDIMKKEDPGKKVDLYPIIVDQKFNNQPKKERLREIIKENGFDPSKRRVLIMSGGEGGSRKSYALLQYLVKIQHLYEILFVCGKSEKVHRIAARIVQKARAADVFLFKFVNNIHELISASDVVVAKAGPASIMESLFLGKPLIIFDYMYGQEQGNIDFVENNKLGLFESKPEKIANFIETAMTPSYLKEFNKNLVKLDLKNGNKSIIKGIMMEKPTI